MLFVFLCGKSNRSEPPHHVHHEVLGIGGLAGGAENQAVDIECDAEVEKVSEGVGGLHLVTAHIRAPIPAIEDFSGAVGPGQLPGWGRR